MPSLSPVLSPCRSKTCAVAKQYWYGTATVEVVWLHMSMAILILSVVLMCCCSFLVVEMVAAVGEVRP